MIKFFNKDLIVSTAHSALVYALRTLKVSWIVGSQAAFFSIAHCINPVIGLYGGLSAICCALFIKLGAIWYTGSLALIPLLVYHIPSFCGALYLNIIAKETPTLIKRALMAALPTLCMILFTTHAVGSQAAAYTLFWLIPIATALVPHKNTFTHALGATFTCHAVGSVLWLYTMNSLSASMWLALIPVVMAERLLFASGMTLCIFAINTMKAFVTNSKKQTLQPLTACK